eukprot:15135237-Alexandrium_andersonii.AAC.1
MGQYDDFSLRPPHGLKKGLISGTLPRRLRPRILGFRRTRALPLGRLRGPSSAMWSLAARRASS